MNSRRNIEIGEEEKKEVEVRVKLAGLTLHEDPLNFIEACNYYGCKEPGVRFYYIIINQHTCILSHACFEHQEGYERSGWYEL